MTENLAQRVNELISDGLSSFDQYGASAIVTPAFYDELRILHSRCSSYFPKEFNKLVKAAKYEGGGRDDQRYLERLNRILEVINSLPIDLRELEDIDPPETATLLPTFDLGKSDKARIFELCNEMRKIVYSTQVFDTPHRLRLLNRIAAIEAETHKPKGMFDVILGGVSDVGETAGKFGKDIKPLVDRIGEIAGITRKGTKDYDQLPAPEEVKQLPPPSDDEMV